MNASTASGSQRVTVPQTASSAPASDSTSRAPSSARSKATVAPAPWTLCPPIGHHAPIRSVKTAKARFRSASTSISRRKGGTAGPDPGLPWLMVLVMGAPRPLLLFRLGRCDRASLTACCLSCSSTAASTSSAKLASAVSHMPTSHCCATTIPSGASA